MVSVPGNFVDTFIYDADILHLISLPQAASGRLHRCVIWERKQWKGGKVSCCVVTLFPVINNFCYYTDNDCKVIQRTMSTESFDAVVSATSIISSSNWSHELG